MDIWSKYKYGKHLIHQTVCVKIDENGSPKYSTRMTDLERLFPEVGIES